MEMQCSTTMDQKSLIAFRCLIYNSQRIASIIYLSLAKTKVEGWGVSAIYLERSKATWWDTGRTCCKLEQECFLLFLEAPHQLPEPLDSVIRFLQSTILCVCV